MPTLGIDIETYSEVDLPKCGVYAYAEHPSFEILLFAYAFDDEETQVVDLKGGERLPPRVLDALTDPAITKTAFNAAFERTCIGRCLGKRLDAAQWQCTAVQSAMLARALLLVALQAHQGQRPAHAQPAGTRPGEVAAVQGILRARRGG